MKVTIKKLNVIDSQCLLIPKDEDAWVEITVDHHIIKLHIQFITKDSESKELTYSFKGKEDYAELKIANWNGQDAALEQPTVFWGNEAIEISLMACFNRLGQESTRMDLQFLKGETL